jgi:hypothetical protein
MRMPEASLRPGNPRHLSRKSTRCSETWVVYTFQHNVGAAFTPFGLAPKASAVAAALSERVQYLDSGFRFTPVKSVIKWLWVSIPTAVTFTMPSDRLGLSSACCLVNAPTGQGQNDEGSSLSKLEITSAELRAGTFIAVLPACPEAVMSAVLQSRGWHVSMLCASDTPLTSFVKLRSPGANLQLDVVGHSECGGPQPWLQEDSRALMALHAWAAVALQCRAPAAEIYSLLSRLLSVNIE